MQRLFAVIAGMVVFTGAMLTLNPGYLSGEDVQTTGFLASLPGIVLFIGGAMFLSIALGAARINREARRIKAGYRRTPFGKMMHFIVGNPVMPLVAAGAVVFTVISIFGYYGANNNGVEFFVESEPEQAIIYVQARGNLSLPEKDALLRAAEDVALAEPGIETVFSFAGDGGLDSNTGGAEGPADAIGQIQLELIPWEERPTVSENTRLLGFIPWTSTQVDPAFDGDLVLANLEEELAKIPGIRFEILNLSRGPASAKPVHLRLSGDNWEELIAATELARAQFDSTPGLITIEDSLPLPGIDWQIDVDVEKAGRYGADVASVGAMVQMVTRGILLDTMRVDSSDEEIEIRVRFPAEDRVLSTLDSLRVRTNQGLIPLSNFITRTPVEKLAEINRVDQKRYFDIKAGAANGLVTLLGDDQPLAVAEISDAEATGSARYDIVKVFDGTDQDALESLIKNDGVTEALINPNERITFLTEWLETGPFANSVSWEWTGDQEDQEESGAFLQTAFAGALGLMFIILLAQFNSFYNAVLVLVAVVMSVAGSLVGMLIMDQPFSIIMTGTGIVALAGIVVNNNIILIDTYQEYSRYMPKTEAITRTAEDRIRPVLLTTITTMAGLAPMMFGLSLDFMAGGYSVDSPTALWWKQLATAVVFGLGIATVLTLVFTPSMLAVRVWVVTYLTWGAQLIAKLSLGRSSRAARDWELSRQAKRSKLPDLVWTDDDDPLPPLKLTTPLRAAE